MYIDANDKKYYNRQFYIYLDGEKQEKVTKANEEEGWIEVIDEEKMEKRRGTFLDNEIPTKKLEGIVTIVEYK